MGALATSLKADPLLRRKAEFFEEFWRGRGAFAFKSYLDIRFMRMFQVSGEAS